MKAWITFVLCGLLLASLPLMAQAALAPAAGGVDVDPIDCWWRTSKAAVERYAMAQNDFMWIPEKEWQAFIPAEPRQGAQVPVPASFALRLFRYHLDPCRGFSEGAAFQGSKADAGKLTLTLEEVTAAKLSFKLAGVVTLQQPGREGTASYEPALLGNLEYDRGKKVFTRFDIVALGDYWGGDYEGGRFKRPGRTPLGIGFELVRGDNAIDLVPPLVHMDREQAYRAYFAAEKKR